MRVYYDLTRLIGRREAEHPTGVDRVDLAYACWFLQEADAFTGLLQCSAGFQSIKREDSRLLLDSLKAKWGMVSNHELSDIECSKVVGTDKLAAQGESVRHTCWEDWRALGEKYRRVPFGELLSERGWTAVLLSILFSGSNWPRVEEVPFFGEDSIYVNIGHCFRFEAAMESIPTEMRHLYFLHDVIPLTHPETQKATSRAHFRKFCEYVGRPGSQVLVSSQATLDAIRSLPDETRTWLGSVEGVQVCPLAVEDRFAKRKIEEVKALEAEESYFLSVGTVEPRKNMQLLVEVWERLLAEGGLMPKLIWVGKFGWSADAQLMKRFARLEQTGIAELRTGVSDSDLMMLMRGARALLFPSKIEGWGLPLSEALSMGIPVIASDIPVFREVGQGVPDLIDPDDAVGWYSAIMDYPQPESKLRQAQLCRIADYKPITWEQHFEGVRVLQNCQVTGGSCKNLSP